MSGHGFRVTAWYHAGPAVVTVVTGTVTGRAVGVRTGVGSVGTHVCPPDPFHSTPI